MHRSSPARCELVACTSLWASPMGRRRGRSILVLDFAVSVASFDAGACYGIKHSCLKHLSHPRTLNRKLQTSTGSLAFRATQHLRQPSPDPRPDPYLLVANVIAQSCWTGGPHKMSIGAIDLDEA